MSNDFKEHEMLNIHKKQLVRPFLSIYSPTQKIKHLYTWGMSVITINILIKTNTDDTMTLQD